MDDIEAVHKIIDRLEVRIEVRVVFKMEKTCLREQLVKDPQAHGDDFILFACRVPVFLLLFLSFFLLLLFFLLFLFRKQKVEFRNSKELKDFSDLYLEKIREFHIFRRTHSHEKWIKSLDDLVMKIEPFRKSLLCKSL